MDLTFVKNYIKWVETHPQLATDLEKGLKWVAYLATAIFKKSKNSLVISELVYKLGNMLTFLNDRVFEQTSRVVCKVEYTKLEYFLAFLENSEVILELAGYIAGGEQGKWLIIVIIQILKTACRTTMLYQHRLMLTYPSISPIDREILLDDPDHAKEFRESKNPEPAVITLPNSGRKIQSIFPNSGSVKKLRLNERQTVGEAIYISAPIVHLILIKKFGMKSWKPWLGSLLCDVASQGCHASDGRIRTVEEKEELRRRQGSLMLYLLRSPFYDKMTKKVILMCLVFTKENIPLGGKLAEILMSYLPHYRSIYAYLWSK